MTLSLSPFQVQCPSCDTEFPVDPDRVPPDGIHAICSVCRRTFFVEVPQDSSYESPDASPASTSLDRAEDDASGAADGFADVNEGALATEAGPEEAAPPADRVFTPPAPGPSERAFAEREEAGEAAVEPPQEAGEGARHPTDELETAPPRASIDDGLEDLSGITAEALAEDGEGESDAGPASLSLGAARFGRRDPHERARRLARVLVSDIIAYYPERHAEAVRRGTVKEEFEDDVEKSRKEYVDQVGAEIADSTPYFREALNEVLARGRQVF